jgi:hypothetical protein
MCMKATRTWLGFEDVVEVELLRSTPGRLPCVRENEHEGGACSPVVPRALRRHLAQWARSPILPTKFAVFCQLTRS